jgi:hypothetical protein
MPDCALYCISFRYVTLVKKKVCLVGSGGWRGKSFAARDRGDVLMLESLLYIFVMESGVCGHRDGVYRFGAGIASFPILLAAAWQGG